jgi:hypothetical protein
MARGPFPPRRRSAWVIGISRFRVLEATRAPLPRPRTVWRRIGSHVHLLRNLHPPWFPNKLIPRPNREFPICNGVRIDVMSGCGEGGAGSRRSGSILASAPLLASSAELSGLLCSRASRSHGVLYVEAGAECRRYDAEMNGRLGRGQVPLACSETLPFPAARSTIPVTGQYPSQVNTRHRVNSRPNHYEECRRPASALCHAAVPPPTRVLNQS